MTEIQANQHRIRISKPEKVLFPDSGVTKRDLVEYYRRIAKYMLPHLEGRPISMHRFPDGIDGKDFFQKEVPNYFPDWITTMKVKTQDGSQQQVVVDSAATLIYLADQACITLHRWLSRTNTPNKPDLLVFDLDPPEENIGAVVEAARILRNILHQCQLTSFVMSTGSRGLHIVCPLNGSNPFGGVRQFAKDLADTLAEMEPDKVTTAQRKEKRQGRVFLDYLRNAYAQTTVAPYAVRALPTAPVATPLDWHELSTSMSPRKYTVKNIFRRLGQKEDPWTRLADAAGSLNESTQCLRRLRAEQGLQK